MSVFKYLKRGIRASDEICDSVLKPINSLFEPINSALDRNFEDASQRNKNEYGFDLHESFPINGIYERYEKWLYSEDEEE